MAKKKRPAKKTSVKKQSSWAGQKLGWLAGLFGLAIAVFSVALYRQQIAAYPPIMEAGDATIVKEWEFDGGVEGWMGKVFVEGYCDDTNLGFGTYSGGTPKKCTKEDKEGSGAPIKLSASGGYLQFNQAGSGARIFNKDMNIDLDGVNSLTVEVTMKANFSNALAKTSGPVVKNTARLELVGKTGSVDKNVTVTADSTGEAVYRFVFSRSELEAKRKVGGAVAGMQGLVRGINFKPNPGDKAVILKNVMIDSITVLSE